MLWLLGWAAVSPHERARAYRIGLACRGGDNDPRLTRAVSGNPCGALRPRSLGYEYFLKSYLSPRRQQTGMAAVSPDERARLSRLE
jgi:hypothetical protein